MGSDHPEIKCASLEIKETKEFNYEEFDKNEEKLKKFKSDFRQSLAKQLKVKEENIIIYQLEKGSVIVKFDVLNENNEKGELVLEK